MSESNTLVGYESPNTNIVHEHYTRNGPTQGLDGYWPATMLDYFSCLIELFNYIELSLCFTG